VSIFDDIKNFIKNLTVNHISCVDKGLFKISNLLHGALDGQRAGSKPHTPFPNLALQSSTTPIVTQPAVHEYIFVHQDHSAKSNDQTPSDYYLF